MDPHRRPRRVRPHEPEIDFATVMAHVRGAQARIAPHDSPERLRGAGVEVIEGEGRLVLTAGSSLQF